MAIDAIDVFAGPGGWDVAARDLGLSVLGIELDDAACATREAAGHATLQADVAALDPRDFPAKGLIGSPPCPTFSAAGNGAGRMLTRILLDCAQALVGGRDTRREAWLAAYNVLATQPSKLDAEKAKARAERDAAMSVLVVEPLRWALANRPEWIALEQVPPVLALWKAFAAILETVGYRCWTGILEAERYGVPQTRERAFLLARLDGQPHPPAPTHQRYVPGEGQRHDVTLEGEIRPWVSMAEALGWGMNARPSVSLTAGTSRQGGPDPLDGGSGARATLKGEREAGRWSMRANAQANAAERDAAEPAPTITGGHDTANRQWMADRPSTNVNGDPRISAPGHHDPAQSGSQQAGAIRVTVQEAAILQGFPADYPWQGSRTKQFGQVGNAVPPPLARAVLAALLGLNAEPIAVIAPINGNGWPYERPAPTVAGNRRSDRGGLVGTSGKGRQLAPGEGRNVGGHGWNDGQSIAMRASVSDAGTDKANPRDASEPAATVNGRHRSAEWVRDGT